MLLNVIPENKWVRGTVPDRAERSNSLDGTQVAYLGDHLKWEGRVVETRNARAGMLRMLQQLDLPEFPDPDRTKTGIFRIGKR